VLGERLKQLRREKRVTQEELAEKAKINRSYLSVLENGHSSPTVDVVERLAQGLGVSLWSLLAEVQEKHYSYDSDTEYEMCDGLRDFLNDTDDMMLAQPSAAEIDELKHIVMKGKAKMDKRFYRDALLAIRRSGKSGTSKS